MKPERNPVKNALRVATDHQNQHVREAFCQITYEPSAHADLISLRCFRLRVSE